MKPTPVTADLFADPASISAVAEFETWFEAWLADARHLGRLRQSSSEDVYRAIWGGFVEWCLSQEPVVRLLDISVADLGLFVSTRRGLSDRNGDLTARYTWRVLNLVDRVLRYAARTSDTPENTAAVELMASLPGVKYANASDTALPDYLPADEARALVIFLSHVRPRSTGPGAAHTWQDLRNRAAVGLQLGAGLTPGDVRALTLTCVVVDGGRLKGVPWKLSVPADGNTPERETPVAQWAGQLLRYWLAVRAELEIPGDWLFPSTKTGKPWGKVAQYNAAQQVLEDAGIDVAEGGSFRLRHTFALRQLRRGKPAKDVARWMGIAKVEHMDRYMRVLHTPEDVV
jgi:integrase